MTSVGSRMKRWRVTVNVQGELKPRVYELAAVGHSGATTAARRLAHQETGVARFRITCHTQLLEGVE